MEGKIEVLVGISGSGKSTYAHVKWLADPKGVLVINRDKIRELLYGYTESKIKDYYERSDIRKLEKLVTKYEDTLILEGLEEGKLVIIDATHLKMKYITRHLYWNVPLTVTTLSTEPDTAHRRVENRNRNISREIISSQYIKYHGLYRSLHQFTTVFEDNILGWKTFEILSKGKKVENNPLNPKTVIYDIDGTLALKGDRDIYDSSKVHLDTVIEPVFDSIPKDTPIIICTGRDDKYREVTEDWLKAKGIMYSEIYFRPFGDNRPDWQVKEEMWNDIAKRYYINYLVDDRAQVVRRARALGLKVLQVDHANF